jgi:NAD(P)-dependent dehydrogenase (short-subunit alcohol dehydrogenase family)
MPNADKTVLITGANTGIGKDIARQLAKRDEYRRIYLACRDLTKGAAAQKDLEQTTGRNVFKVVPLDLANLDSARSVVDGISEPLDALVMNAGGFGGPTPQALTPDGVTNMFAQNILGHVVLLETLLEKNALTGVAVLAGSEAARGAPKFGVPVPKFKDSSVAEFSSVIDGSFFAHRRYKMTLAYGQAKYLGVLWMAALARSHPELRLLTVSPGNTAGTEAARDMPAPVRVFITKFFYPVLAPRLHLAHKLEKGAAQLVDGVSNPKLRSGVFYASPKGKVVGPLTDQGAATPAFRDPKIQDNAVQAIHRFIRTADEAAKSPRPAGVRRVS